MLKKNVNDDGSKKDGKDGKNNDKKDDKNKKVVAKN